MGLLLSIAGHARADDAATDELLARSRATRAAQVEVVTALLARDDGRSRAWGASLAADHGLHEATPRLRELAAQGGYGGDRAAWPALLAVYDALLRLDARVDAREVMAAVRRGSTLFGPAAVALLVRGGDDAACAEVFDGLDAQAGSDEASWVAVGNTLVARKARGAAVRFLGGLTLRLAVSVRADDAISGGGGRYGSRHGDGRIDVPEGYPPIFLTGLTERPAPGDVVLAVGRRTVYLHRRPLRRGFGSSSRTPQPRDEARLGWLADLVGQPPEALPVKLHTSVGVRWTDAAGYLAEVEPARAEVLAGYWRLAQLVVDAGAATLEEARALRPRLEVEVEDEREAPAAAAAPLPPLPPLPPIDGTCPWPAVPAK